MTLYFVVVFQLLCAIAFILTLRTRTSDKKKKRFLAFLASGAVFTATAGMAAVKFCLPKAMTALKEGLSVLSFCSSP